MKEEYEEAIQYSQKALNIYLNLETGDHQRDIAFLYNDIGVYNFELGNKDDVFLMMRKSFETVKEKENKKAKDFYEDILRENIKTLYIITADDGTDYKEWFQQNFESYEGDPK